MHRKSYSENKSMPTPEHEDQRRDLHPNGRPWTYHERRIIQQAAELGLHLYTPGELNTIKTKIYHAGYGKGHAEADYNRFAAGAIIGAFVAMAVTLLATSS